MKKLFVLGSLIMLFTMAVKAQAPVLAFENTAFDFGTIQEEDGKVTATFEFINEGEEPLVISNVKGSCGCAVSSWTREPVPANDKGFIKVAYNPKGRPGSFNKSVTVTSNAVPETVRLSIKGNVVRSVSQNK